MRLTHIKLAGFKSFIDPTTIHLPNQLVAVIGPNGCGKSNVIDAVRWVLGEASAKQLRGENMQDVIFNGAATRRPAPRAWVELIFDNHDHALQGVWGQYSEISIKRQLTRQGESSYFINSQPVRRRDITDLFLGTGVGARGYAVIEQGMISRIIEARPEELRVYIEEAAGVSKYKERRKETETRLKDTREHLQRLADLQSELARQVEKLEKQANTAAQYRQWMDELAHLENILNYINWQNALADADHASTEHVAAQLQLENFTRNQQRLNEQLQSLRETEQDQQQQNQSLNQEYALLREQIARLEEQIRAQKNQQQRTERERAAAQNMLSKIQYEQMLLTSERDLIEKDLVTKKIEINELAVYVTEYETKLPELEEAQRLANINFQNQQEELNRIKRELALKQQQLEHIQASLTAILSRQTRLENEKNTLNLPNDEELSLAQQNVDALQQQYDELENALHHHETVAISLKQALKNAKTQYDTLFQQSLTIQAQQQALASLLTQSPQHDFWTQLSATDAPVLWQYIDVSKDWQHAVSVILAERLHARLLEKDFVLPDDIPQGAAAWIQFSDVINLKSQPADALFHQIRVDKRFQAALQYWLDGVLCAPSLAYALAQQNDLQNHQIWLTPEGHRVDKLSVVLYDEHNLNQLIGQKTRYDELQTQLAELTPQLADAEVVLKNISLENQQHEDIYRDVQAQQRIQVNALQTAHNQASQLFARTNQGQLRCVQIEQELTQLIDESQYLMQQRDSLIADVDALTCAIEELEHQYQQYSQTYQQQQNITKQTQLALLESNRQYGLAEIALHKQQQRLDMVEQQLDALTRQQMQWQERQLDLALIEDESDMDAERQTQFETLVQMADDLQEQIVNAQQRLTSTQEQIRDLYVKQQDLSASQPSLQQEIQAALLKQQEHLIRAKGFHQHLLEAQVDLLLLQEQAKSAQPTEIIEKNIVQFNQKIQSLGAVNLVALEELSEARERDDYYRSQSTDVQAAISLLEEAIGQIDNETKIRFKETFDLVNEKVQSFFPTLFGGGEATLQMVGDDLLTAGVSIMARPPGKKNSTIHLLSGGEKALTAMSLVFALFSLNPAPFCLLDEVDAPLDDANTSRFCHLVKEMSVQTQFLYISHNRLTMEMAQQLVGVTMQEKGVSRIVAVDIQQALTMAE